MKIQVRYMKISFVKVAIATIAMCVTALATTGSAIADDEVVSSKLEAFVVSIDADGDETFLPAKNVLPGQEIEYRIVYTNNSEEDLGKFIVNGDVPEKTVFVLESDSSSLPVEFEAEVLDLGWVTLPAYREIRKKDGTIEKILIGPSEISSVRWKVKDTLPAKESIQTKYRVKVDS